MIKNQDMVYLHGQVETYIKEVMKMIQEITMAKCIGQMGVFIKDSGKMVFNMGKAKFIFLDKD